MIKTYYLLTKPGIIAGNLLTTAGAFALASRDRFDIPLFLSTSLGLFFVIASACVFNNYIDREADRKMARTKHRGFAKEAVSIPKALGFASVLGIMGISVLALFTNWIAVSVAFFGFFVYVMLYSFWKYRTTYATLVGSISGAVPPVIGYCAASHSFDWGAFFLFTILVLWQMPHFFAIAMYRFDDYTAASIPVLPIKRGNYITKLHMLSYILAFIGASLMLYILGYTGYSYLIAAVLSGVLWLLLCIQGFKSTNDRLWAQKMFRFSLVVIMAISIGLSI